MMEISEGGVDISGNYNPLPSSTNTTISAGVNFEVSASGISSSFIIYSGIIPIFPANGNPPSILVQGAGSGDANGTYLYYPAGTSRPTYRLDDDHWISYNMFTGGWAIKYTKYTDLHYYKSTSRSTFPPKDSWFSQSGAEDPPTLVYEGGEEPTSAPPDMVMTAGPTTNFPAVFADFAPTVAPVAPNQLTPEVAEFTRQADAGDTIALTGEEL
jgi:hypothetical protein